MSNRALKLDFSVTLLLAAVAVLATTTAWGTWLVADVHKILSGQVWRLVTGPLVHANAGHLIRDLAACLVLGFLYEPIFRNQWPWILLVGLVVPSTVALAVHPDLAYYCGLSGTAHALMAVAVVYEFRGASFRPHWILTIIAAVFVIKLIYEAATGSLLLPLDLGAGVRAVPSAHLAGAVSGGVMGFVFSDRMFVPVNSENEGEAEHSPGSRSSTR